MKLKLLSLMSGLAVPFLVAAQGPMTMLQAGQTDIRQQTVQQLTDPFAPKRFESKGFPKTPRLECKGIEGVYCDHAPVVGAMIQFDLDRSAIKRQYRSLLDEIALTLRNDLKDAVILVAGHADSQGSDRYNAHLSARRATAVYEYLVQQGVPSQRLQTKGYGEKHALCDNATGSGRAWNRRVEFMRVETLDRNGQVVRRFKPQPSRNMQGSCTHAPA